MAERVDLPHESGFEGKQFKLSVTDSLGLQEGQEGIFYWLSFVVGSKDVTLAEYFASIDRGKVDIKPWSWRYDPGPEPPKFNQYGTNFAE